MDLFGLLFPRKCLGCGSRGGYICLGCLSKARKGSRRGVYSLFAYEGVIKKAILALKYKFAFDLASQLAEVCVAQIKAQDFGFRRAVLLPVPLHHRRQTWRGFNQTEVVGKLVAQKLGWQFYSHILVCPISSRPQVGLTGPQRLRNIRGKYAVNQQALKPLKGKTLVIFDDVWTTGATLGEIRKILRLAGAKRIYGLTIAA